MLMYWATRHYEEARQPVWSPCGSHWLVTARSLSLSPQTPRPLLPDHMLWKQKPRESVRAVCNHVLLCFWGRPGSGEGRRPLLLSH